MSIFEQLHHKKWALLLDSASGVTNVGRYTYIAIDPFKTIWVKDGQIKINDRLIQDSIRPFSLLKELLSQMRDEAIAHLPPFQGGVAGAFSYDLYQYMENISAHAVDETLFPDMALGFYDVVISFDALLQKAWIISTGWPETEPCKRKIRAKKRLKAFETLVKNSLKHPHSMIKSAMDKVETITSNFNEATYIQAVQEVKDFILAGDIFEANISQCFKAELPASFSAFDLYKQLRTKNPAPFAAYFNVDPFFVLSASPERFLQLAEGKVQTRPIKGTRPRSLDPELDSQYAQMLQTSEKDRAENTMIVDLLRNDLSKVCKEHSVCVKKLCALESFASVHHLVSVVEGELKCQQDAVDLLIAAFPGGSVTGAPKIRAMEIIAQIEPSKRGLYCGSLGFIGFNGTMDTSIVIRTYLIKENTIRFQSGGAVVLDSLPLEEYQESLTKAAALYELLAVSHDFIN